MPKEVRLTRKPTQQELLAQVTGRAAPAAAPRPQLPQPPGKLPPGVGGTLPLPTARPVVGLDPRHLSGEEVDTLRALGWNENVPIPSNVAALVQQQVALRRAEADEPVLPVDPRTPPVEVTPPVAIDTLPEAEQQRFRDALRTAHAQQTQAAAATAPGVGPQGRPIPGLQAAVKAAQQAAAAGSGFTAPTIEDDRGELSPAEQAAAAGNPAMAKTLADKERWLDKQNAERRAPPAPPPPVSDTGADARPAFCPHCGHNQAMPSIPEPAYAEKMAFLHALLGLKSFLKEYPLFGGVVTVTFRTLTARELDAAFRQAWLDHRAGKTLTEADYYERINRYRLFLQLQSLRGSGPDGFFHDLPDGLSKETNPDGTAFWDTGDNVIDAGGTALPLIEEHVVGSVIKTEAMFRVVNAACNQFNRLVAKMEALADNSDFWQRTEPPS